MLDAFRPNKKLSRKAWTAILSVQAAFLWVAWTAASRWSIPGPLEIISAVGRLIREDHILYEFFAVSLSINVEALVITSVLSVGLAYLTVVPFMRPVVEFCATSRFLPMTGFVTPFTLAFGGGHGLKVALMVFGMSVFFITAMASAVVEIPKADWDHAKSLRMSPWRSVKEIVILGKADVAFEIFRQNAAMGWMMLTMVEGLVRSEGGVGSVLLNHAKYRHWDAVFAIMFILFVTGVAQDRFIAFVKSVFCPYANMSLERP